MVLNWESITAIFTAALFILGWWQLNKLNQTTSADFLHHFVEDFFTPETRYLIILFDMGWITFDSAGPMTQFHISKAPEAKKIAHELGQTRSFYTAYEVDDLLLGQFEDIAVLVRKEVVQVDMVYNTLSWYLYTIWKNKEIEAYIKWHRHQKNCSDVYKEIDYLVEEFDKYGQAKLTN
jgi:hypothetical protein